MICLKELIVLIYNIEWDFSDFEKGESLPQLPTSITHHFPFFDLKNDEDTFVEIISNWLSDEYGYCHYGFKYRILNVCKG